MSQEAPRRPEERFYDHVQREDQKVLKSVEPRFRRMRKLLYVGVGGVATGVTAGSIGLSVMSERHADTEQLGNLLFYGGVTAAVLGTIAALAGAVVEYRARNRLDSGVIDNRKQIRQRVEEFEDRVKKGKL